MDGTVQLTAHGLQLTLQLRHAQGPGHIAVHSRGQGRQHPRLHAAQQKQARQVRWQRMDLDVERPHLALQRYMPAGDHPHLPGLGRINRLAQRRPHPRPRQGKDIMARLTAGQAQIAIHRPQGEQHLMACIDENGGRGISLQHQPPARLRQRDFARRGSDGHGARCRHAFVTRQGHQIDPPGPTGGLMPIKPCRFVHDREVPVLSEVNGLSTAQQQNPVTSQRKIKQRDHPRLRLRLQIDQHVAA